MNEFEYRILDKKIDAFTTIKQHEQCARELHKKLMGMGSAWGNHIRVDFNNYGVTTYENIYKALQKTIKNYKGTSGLPGFIHNTLNRLHAALTERYVNYPSSYERFIDVFQFDDIVYFGSIGNREFKALTLLIMDHNPNFSIMLDFYPSNIYSSASRGFNISSSLNNCLEIEELKHELPNNIKYTIIEQTLTKYYENIICNNGNDSTNNTTKDTMPDFVKAMEHLVEVSKIACERINRENFG